MRKIIKEKAGVSAVIGTLLSITIGISLFSVVTVFANNFMSGVDNVSTEMMNASNKICKALQDFNPDYTKTVEVLIYNETIKYVSNGDGIVEPKVEWQQNKTTGGYDIFISCNATLYRFAFLDGILYNNDEKYIPPLIPD